MSSYPQRQPPRFVPTLTQVVADEPVMPGAELPAASAVPPARADIAPTTAPPFSPYHPHPHPHAHAAPLQQLEEQILAQVQTAIEDRIATLMHKQLPVLMGAVVAEMLQDLRPIVQQALQDVEKQVAR